MGQGCEVKVCGARGEGVALSGVMRVVCGGVVVWWCGGVLCGMWCGVWCVVRSALSVVWCGMWCRVVMWCGVRFSPHETFVLFRVLCANLHGAYFIRFGLAQSSNRIGSSDGALLYICHLAEAAEKQTVLLSLKTLLHQQLHSRGGEISLGQLVERNREVLRTWSELKPLGLQEHCDNPTSHLVLSRRRPWPPVGRA